jgi:putative YhdH/YhfP family quinone oxidoreductase
MIVSETEDKRYMRRIAKRSIEDLPPGEVLVEVHYSSLNYKDALSCIGNRGVTRRYPHTPGVDAAGVVSHSAAAEFKPGDPVIVTSYDLGMNTAGGFGQYIRVPAAWVVPLPENLSLSESMAYGTAGFTAGMCLQRLEAGGIGPQSGEVLVTGASGGVGSIAVGLLAGAGYRVAAVSGKREAAEFLGRLGAAEVIPREEAMDTEQRPLLKGRWAGVVDTVGGGILATALKSTLQWAVVTCCGLVASPKLDITVFPFILRGVTLCGIDSQNCPMDLRRRIWRKLAGDWKFDGLADLCREVSLEALDEEIDAILKGAITGRVVVNPRD